MMIFKNIILSTILTAVCFSGICQAAKEYEKKYKSAQELLKSENYESAVMIFQSITPENSENHYVEYANYYTAFCYFKLNKLKNSREYLYQLINKYPNSKPVNDARYLLANIELINQNYEKALEVCAQITDPKIKSDCKNLEIHYLSQINSTHLLQLLYQKFPNDDALATVLAYKLSTNSPLFEDDKALINELISKHNIKSNKLKNRLESNTTDYFKDTFNIAVLYPFNLENLQLFKPIIDNQFVIDHYWGLQLAIDTLHKQNIHLKLHAYDTKNDAKIVEELLKHEEMKQIDLIIGPIYKTNLSATSKFSHQNHIIEFSPFSRDIKSISDSGYTFMYEASYEQIALNCANFITDSLKPNKILIVSQQSHRDTTITHHFKKQLTSKKLPFIEVSIKKNEDVLFALSKVNIDEIDAIFSPSSSSSVATNLTSWIIIKKKDLPILGNSAWLDSKEFNIETFYQKNLYLFDENHINYKKDSDYRFKEKYFQKTNMIPSSESYKGFEIGMLVGHCLSSYGKYFSESLENAEPYQGIFYPVFDYKNSHCNKFVPIFKLVNYELIPSNFKYPIQE